MTPRRVGTARRRRAVVLHRREKLLDRRRVGTARRQALGERDPDRKRRGAERGSAMTAVLLALLVIAMAIAAWAFAFGTRRSATRREARQIRLTALADAALAEGLAEVGAAAAPESIPAHDFGGGRIRCAIVAVGSELYRLEAVASYRGENRTIRARVRRVDLGEGRAVAELLDRERVPRSEGEGEIDPGHGGRGDPNAP